MELLTVEQAFEIGDAYFERRNRFPNEDGREALVVVLMNYADRFTTVRCVNGEWTGVKKDLKKTSGVPTCPGGHVLVENSSRVQLGLIPYTLT